MVSTLHQIQDTLQSLQNRFGLTAIKTGTEAEDMSFVEIRLIKKIFGHLIPILAKIGGPEARNDIRELMSIPVDGLISPMVESPYALTKFIDAIRYILPESTISTISIGINLETIVAYQNISDIFESPAMSFVSRVTAARTDLSESMGLAPDDDRVLYIVSDIVNKARQIGKKTSIGGSILPEHADYLVNNIHPDFINTRHLLFDVEKMGDDPEHAIREGLSFEIDLYETMMKGEGEHFSERPERIRLLRKRIQ